jgi:transposase
MLAGVSGGGRAMAKISVLGVDLGKNVCSVVGLDASGAVVVRRRMRRDTLIGLAEKLPACVVGMEACWAPITLAVSSPATATTSG